MLGGILLGGAMLGGGPAGSGAASSSLAGSAAAVASAAGSLSVAQALSGAARATATARGNLLAPADVTYSAWRPVLTIGAVDHSARLTGTVTVEAEEGAARIAELSLLLPAGSVDPLAWVGAALTIDYAQQQPDGSAAGAVRLFTGIIESFALDHADALARVRCTDNRQGRMQALSRAQVDALTASALWHTNIHRDTADSYQYAEQRMSTLPASLDLDPGGVPRLCLWEASAVPDYTYTDASILDGSVSPQWADRTRLINRVAITYTHRVPRLKKRGIAFSYTFPFDNDACFTYGLSLPIKQQIQDAIAGTGWDVSGAMTWTDVSAGSFAVTGGVYVVSPILARECCKGASATLVRRYVQTVERVYSLTVSCAASVAQLGAVVSERQASMDTAFNQDEWERMQPTTPALIGELSAQALSPWDAYVAAPSAGTETAWDFDQDPAATAAQASAAMAVLIRQAQRDIRASHRAHRVAFATVLRPALDVAWTVRVNVTGLQASGKIARVRHIMDLDAGAATTECEIAISRAFGAVAGASDPTAPAVPAFAPPTGLTGFAHTNHIGACATNQSQFPASVDYPADLIASGKYGYFTNLLNTNHAAYTAAAAKLYPVQFHARVPEIESAHRDTLQQPAAASYEAGVPNDELSVTL